MKLNILLLLITAQTAYSMDQEKPLSSQQNTLAILKYFANIGTKINEGQYTVTKPISKKSSIVTNIAIGSIVRGSKYLNSSEQQIGYLDYCIIDKKCYVSIFYINEGFRKQGNGKILLQELIEELHNYECSKISIDSLDSSRIFYEKNGFASKKKYGTLTRKL